ncbi:MAG TPA: NYN domain-containing protein [Trebonia sp.]|nr:NYN domain-containing protein [Trebonia sp.]
MPVPIQAGLFQAAQGRAVPARVGVARVRSAGGGGRMSARRRFPARTLHLVDIENLAGAAVPTLTQVMDVQDRYARRMALGVDDQVIMASNHLALVNAAVGWPHARYRVRSGPNGADLELLDVIEYENVATRFTHVVIGSGDGMFGRAAEGLGAGGVRVTVVSLRRSLSAALARAARHVVYLDAPLGTTGTGVAAVATAARA